MSCRIKKWREHQGRRYPIDVGTAISSPTNFRCRSELRPRVDIRRRVQINHETACGDSSPRCKCVTHMTDRPGSLLAYDVSTPAPKFSICSTFIFQIPLLTYQSDPYRQKEHDPKKSLKSHNRQLIYSRKSVFKLVYFSLDKRISKTLHSPRPFSFDKLFTCEQQKTTKNSPRPYIHYNRDQ